MPDERRAGSYSGSRPGIANANPFVRVWSEKDYRRLSVLMLVAGVSVSSAIPLVTLFLTGALGVGESAAGCSS
jgi:hypothetical protein